jgi:hypothetical protein
MLGKRSKRSGDGAVAGERRRRFLERTTYANVMSTLAFVVAMSMGAAYAAPLITGSQIAKETVTGTNIKNESVTSNDLALGSIGSTRVKDGSLLISDLKPGEVAPGRLVTHARKFIDTPLDIGATLLASTDPAEPATDNAFGPIPILPPNGLVAGVVGINVQTTGSGTWSCSVYRDTPGNTKLGEFTSTTATMNETLTFRWFTNSQQSYVVHFRLYCSGSGRTVTDAFLDVVAGSKPNPYA